MGFGSLDQSGFLRMFKRLQGTGGYTEDDASTRVKELSAIARVASMVAESIESAARNTFVSQASELLSDYERLMYLPSDAGLMDEQRQSRLLTFRRALPKMIATRLTAAFDAFIGGSSGATKHTYGNASYDTFAASQSGGLQLSRQQPGATDEQMRLLDVVLSRGLPARALGGNVSTGNATFGSGSIDRKGLNTTPTTTPPAQTKALAAPREYYPGSVVKAEDWREIQAQLLWKSRGFTIDQTQQGRSILAVGSVASGATAVLDGPTSGGAGAISWASRFVQAYGVYSSTDIRPSGSPDLAAATTTDACWVCLAKTGTTGTPYSHRLIDLATGADLNAVLSIDGSGNLTLNNPSGVTKYFVLMIRCTPVHTVGSSTDTQPLAHATDITSALLTEVARSAEIRAADSAASWTKYALSGQTGAIRRICYTGGLAKSATAGSRQTVLLDSSEDWRNRYVLIIPLSISHGTRYPAANADGMDIRAGSSSAGPVYPPRLFYTGSGTAEGNATALGYQHPDYFPGATYGRAWIYAGGANGELKAEMKATDSVVPYADMMFLAIGSERIDGSGVATQVPLDATQVHPLDLNQIQNNGCFAQGFQGGVPRRNLTDVARALPTCPPLGPISGGGSMPLRPVKWSVRERIGDISDSTYEVRQKLNGQRKRLVSIAVAAGATVALDLFNDPTNIQPSATTADQMDFRDRFVYVEGRFSTTNISISNGAPATDAAATRFCGTLYTGPIADQVFTIGALTFTAEFSRKGTSKGYHSRMVVTNTGGSTIYLNAAIEASGFLGLTDRRLFGASP